MKVGLQKINKQQRIVYERHFAVNPCVPAGGGDVVCFSDHGNSHPLIDVFPQFVDREPNPVGRQIAKEKNLTTFIPSIAG